MAKASQKEGEGEFCELKVAQRMIQQQPDRIEIRNHWRKDACLHEDTTRSRNPNIVAAMAMLRNGLLFFVSQDSHTSNINAFTETVAADSDRALDMLLRRF